VQREAAGELQLGTWAAAREGRRHGGDRRVLAWLRGGGARREATAAGELQLDSGAAARGWKRHGSCSNEGRLLRIGGVRRIDPDGDSVLQAK
jgi:hypothetical protein